MTDVQIHWFSIINSVVVVFFLSGGWWAVYVLVSKNFKTVCLEKKIELTVESY
jgi:hypothetical protein